MRKDLKITLMLAIALPLLALSFYTLKVDAGVEANADQASIAADLPVNGVLLCRANAFIDGAPARSGATVTAGSRVKSGVEGVQIALGRQGRVELEPSTEVAVNFDREHLTVTVLSGIARIKANSGVETKLLTATEEVAHITGAQPAEAVIAKVGNKTDVLPISGEIKVNPTLAVSRPQDLRVEVVSGTQQVAAVQNTYSEKIAVKVTDNTGKAVPGAVVHFSAPTADNASLVFNNGKNQAMAISDANGIALSPVFRANRLDGNFAVQAATTEAKPVTIAFQNQKSSTSNMGALRGALGGNSSNSTIRGGQGGGSPISPIFFDVDVPFIGSVGGIGIPFRRFQSP